ncbi:hypothetical protein ACOME3_010093 [Neoechinorhynchus agilis]
MKCQAIVCNGFYVAPICHLKYTFCPKGLHEIEIIKLEDKSMNFNETQTSDNFIQCFENFFSGVALDNSSELICWESFKLTETMIRVLKFLASNVRFEILVL